MRTEWKFQYKISDILEGVARKFDFHKQRVEWWEVKKVEAKEKIRGQGIEFDESQTDLLSNSYSRGTSVTINSQFVNDLREAVDKVFEHDIKMKEYHAWMQVLESQKPDNVLDLDQSDWMFFFGR